MSLPCVEVADAQATEAFLTNPGDTSLVQPALDLLKNTKGIIKVYYGLQTEEMKHAYVYNVWEDIQDHRNLQADAVNYPVLGKYCGQFMTTAADVTHIQVTSEPYKALRAPATELAYISVKQGQSREKVEEKVNTLATLVNGLPEIWGGIFAVWGPTIEKDDTLGLIVGWTSVDAHWNTVNTVPEIIELLAEIRQIADISLTHSQLSMWN